MIKRIFLVLNVSLTAVLILIGLSTLRSLRPIDIEDPPEAIEGHRISLPQPPARPLSHYSAIIGQRAWFGVPPPDFDEEIPGLLETLPRTDLKLRLKGTIYSSPPLSRAIIKDLSRGQQSLHRLGDLVAGAKIVRIERSRVVIEREGRQEVLLMAYGEEGLLARRGEPKEAPFLSHLHPTTPPTMRPMRLGEGEMATAAEVTQKVAKKLRLDLDDLPEAPANLIEAIRVANRILTRARIRPHFVGRRLEGFRLAAIQPGSIYERLGLEKGDIIRGVNGQRINSIRDAFRLFQELRQQPTVTVDIKRDGQPLSLDFEIR